MNTTTSEQRIVMDGPQAGSNSPVVSKNPAASLPRNGSRTTLRICEYAAGLFLAVVLLRSSIGHLGNPYYFLSSVYHYEIVGPWTGRMIAMILPWLELYLAVCLIIRLFVDGAYLASALLFTLFLGVQISATVRGLDIACGCFGAGRNTPVGATSISMVTLFLGLASFGLLWRTSERRRTSAKLPA